MTIITYGTAIKVVCEGIGWRIRYIMQKLDCEIMYTNVKSNLPFLCIEDILCSKILKMSEITHTMIESIYLAVN